MDGRRCPITPDEVSFFWMLWPACVLETSAGAPGGPGCPRRGRERYRDCVLGTLTSVSPDVELCGKRGVAAMRR
jgi:hypothetical protein